MDIRDIAHLLKSAQSVEEIDAHREEILYVFPQLRIMVDYDQNNHAHQYDLWFHSLHTVMFLPRGLDDDMLYIGALLHDIGKPDCRCKGRKEGDTNAHYYGHPEKSYEIVRDDIIPYFVGHLHQEIFDFEKEVLLYYVHYHDDHVSLKIKHLRRHLKMVDIDTFKKLMLLQVADAKAHVMIPIIEERVRICSILAGEYADELKAKIDSGQ